MKANILDIIFPSETKLNLIIPSDIMIQFTMNIFLIDTEIVLRQSFTTIKAEAGYGGNYL